MRKKILIADDDTRVINEARDVLEKTGYEVVSVMSGEEALEKLQNNHYDLLLTDYIMSSLSDPQLTKIIRKNPQYSGLPIILMTKNPTEMDKRTAEMLGCSGTLNKKWLPPIFNRNELVKLVQTHLLK